MHQRTTTVVGRRRTAGAHVEHRRVAAAVEVVARAERGASSWPTRSRDRLAGVRTLRPRSLAGL
ncbi:MAG: hypothetical protein ABWZ99_04910, partial [Ilumatobacteraceae bacterium]